MSARGRRIEEGEEATHLFDAFTFSPFSFLSSDRELLSWGRGKRGWLGRDAEDSCDPKPIVFESPHSIPSMACSHGNTLLLTTIYPALLIATPYISHLHVLYFLLTSLCFTQQYLQFIFVFSFKFTIFCT